MLCIVTSTSSSQFRSELGILLDLIMFLNVCINAVRFHSKLALNATECYTYDWLLWFMGKEFSILSFF